MCHGKINVIDSKIQKSYLYRFRLMLIYSNRESDYNRKKTLIVKTLETSIEKMAGIEQCKIREKIWNGTEADWKDAEEIWTVGDNIIELEITPFDGTQLNMQQKKDIRQKVREYYSEISDTNIVICQIAEFREGTEGTIDPLSDEAKAMELQQRLEDTIQEFEEIKKCTISFGKLSEKCNMTVTVECSEGHQPSDELELGIKKLIAGSQDGLAEDDIIIKYK